MTQIDAIEQLAQPKTKAQQVKRLLASTNGATLAELMEPTGWQANTCRAFLTGLRKKGRVLARDKREDGSTFYRLIADEKAEKADVVPAECSDEDDV